MIKAIFILLISVLPMSVAFSQAYPVKPVRFIVPYPPGGGTDLVGRAIAAKISEPLGQQVIVDNRPGAQGNVGTSVALKSPADGYTMVLSYVGTVAMNPWLYKSIGYDSQKDFAHISLATVQPYVVVANPVVPVKNLKELAALAKAQPGRLTFASSAAAGQLAGEFFKMLTNTSMLHIPFKGAGPAAINVMGGHVDLMFATPAGSVPQVKAGKLRALAVTASTRLDALPNVLTSKESGFPEFEISGWYGVAVPANTPKDIVMRLNTEIVNALKSSDVRDRLNNEGIEARSNSPDEMTAFAKSEYARWGKVIKSAGIKPE